MKITCEYCGTLYDDTLDKCPSCQAQNAYAGQAAQDNPVRTIEDLKKWYEDRNLPPYETTRFFIGINYTKPRAFGIYKDGENFIVYKNKDNGQRAVRYEGTDEAFAVNELYMRLKEEILNQKNHNVSKAATPSGTNSKGKGIDNLFNKIVPLTYIFFIINIFVVAAGAAVQRIEDEKTFKLVIAAASVSLALFAILIVFAYVIFWIKTIKDLIFKHKFSDIVTTLVICVVISFFALIGLAGVGVGGYALNTSVTNHKNFPREGYYLADNFRNDAETVWYRYEQKWYAFIDGEWVEGWKPYLEADDSVNYDKFTTVPEDKFLGTDCTDTVIRMGYTDFFESPVYKDLSCAFVRGYYKYDDKVYYHLTESDSEWYYYDTETSDWVNEYSDDVPPELKHASLAQDFYYTPTWDSETQMTDFEDTEDYQEQIEEEARRAAASSSYESSSSSNDSSYDWDSSDSWDSGSSDWDSDW